MRPVFLSRRVYDFRGNSRIVKEQHLRLVIHQHDNITIDGIGFGMADKFLIVSKGPFDVVYTLDENDYNGKTSIQMRIIDIKEAG